MKKPSQLKKMQLSGGHGIPARKLARNSHYILLILLLLFVIAAIILGEWLGFYDSIWWWDDMLHGVAGMLVGFIGLLAIYFFNSRHTMAISPLFVAVFVFCFAMCVSALWEIFEFTMDASFGSNMQKWDVPPTTIVIGKSYQGMGLRDTMSDLIVATVGSVIAAVFSFFAYKNEKRTVLSVMRRVFPWLVRSRKKKS